MKIFRLYVIQCLRSKEVLLSLILITALGLLSIGIGKAHLDKQKEEIAEVKSHQEAHLKRQVDFHNDDLGLLLYYAKFAHINTLNPLAGISIGQSDLNPTVKQITIKTFEAQRFDTDLINPVNLLSGNLDISFIIIYLLPLLVIVFTYNVVSEETETGTWRLIAIQTNSKLKFIVSKLLVRFLLICLVLLVLFSVAKITLDIPMNNGFIMMISTSFFYLLFWFLIAFVIVILKKSSRFNALLLLSLWLVLLILLPAGINAYITQKYPVPEALSTAISQRDGYHVKWDTDKLETIKKFYAHYPQFETYGYPTEGFNWLWYYAMQQMGDDDSREDQEALNEKLAQRESAAMTIASFIPNLHVQLSFNRLAGTSMAQHMEYLNETEAFHEKLRLFFYPKIFEKQTADAINWNQFTPVFYNTKVQYNGIDSILSLLIFIGLLLVASIPLTKKL